MAFLKYLARAALATAAIAALPVTGPVVAIAAAGAAGAAAVAAGKLGEARRNERAEQARTKAEEAATVREMQAKLEQAAARFADHKALEEFLVAAFALGIAAAHADGTFSEEEQAELAEIIAGEAYQAIPAGVRQQIQKLYDNPPSLATAIALAGRVSPTHWDAFDRVIDLIIDSDGDEHPEETAFREAWRRYRQMA